MLSSSRSYYHLLLISLSLNSYSLGDPRYWFQVWYSQIKIDDAVEDCSKAIVSFVIARISLTRNFKPSEKFALCPLVVIEMYGRSIAHKDDDGFRDIDLKPHLLRWLMAILFDFPIGILKNKLLYTIPWSRSIPKNTVNSSASSSSFLSFREFIVQFTSCSSAHPRACNLMVVYDLENLPMLITS